MAIPGLLLLLLFFGGALYLIVERSLIDPSPENYRQLAQAVYVDMLTSTFRAAAMTTLTALALGYVYAYAMAFGSRILSLVLIANLVIQFATSWLAKVYSWYMLLAPRGVINVMLLEYGIISSPLRLMGNDLGMVIGTTHIMLPMMVLVLYLSMTKVNISAMNAARSLGATRAQVFRHIFIPNTMSGIIGGCGLVFVMSLGFYITPALLGDQTRPMISALIVIQTEQMGNFGFAAALSVVLLVLTSVCLVLFSIISKKFETGM